MQTSGISGVRMLHAAPGLAPVDVYVNDARAAGDLAYGTLGDYYELAHGRQHAEIRLAGADGPALAGLEFELRPAQVDTLVVCGLPRDLRVFTVQDNIWAFERDQARLRLLHAAPGAPPLDIVTADGQVLFQAVGYSVATPYRPVEPGAYDLEAHEAAGKDLLLTLPEVTLAGGTIHTLIALGLVRGEPALRLMPVLEAIEICTQG